MNQRLQQLSLEAELFAKKNNKDFHYFYTKKLSDLIVTECANVLLEWKKEPFPLDPDFAAKIVKEHFGVDK